jgi:hypothetical protein
VFKITCFGALSNFKVKILKSNMTKKSCGFFFFFFFFFFFESLRYFVFQMVLKFLSFLVHHINPLPHIAMFFLMSSLVVNE